MEATTIQTRAHSHRGVDCLGPHDRVCGTRFTGSRRPPFHSIADDPVRSKSWGCVYRSISTSSFSTIFVLRGSRPVSLIVWSYGPRAVFDGRERWWIPSRIGLGEWVGRDPLRPSSRYLRLLRRNPNDNNALSATLETKPHELEKTLK